MTVITAPTSKIGRQVLSNLLSSGESIGVVARDPSKLDLEVRQADQRRMRHAERL